MILVGGLQIEGNAKQQGRRKGWDGRFALRSVHKRLSDGGQNSRARAEKVNQMEGKVPLTNGIAI